MAPFIPGKKPINAFPKPSPNLPTRAFLNLLAASFLYILLQQTPPRLTRHSSPPGAISTESSIPHQEPQPNLPPPLSAVLPPFPGSLHNFTVPQLISFYYDTLSNGSTKLYLVTSGIMMGASRRNFSVAACLVGKDIYPSHLFFGEVAHCVMPRRLVPGERLAPVLAYDHALREAEKGVVRLATGVMARLYPGDISVLPDDAVLRGSLSERESSEFRVARSAHSVGASDNFEFGKGKDRPRYQLCQMTMVAPNSHMIDDWANYHRRIGVDMVYIFDNGASLDLATIYRDRVDIEVIQWPYHKSQNEAVSTFLFMARARCERVFMHDSDEYAMFGLGDGSCLSNGTRPMIRYSNKARERGFDNVKLLYLIMTNSGFLYRPKSAVPLNYIHRREKNDFPNGKTICHVDSEDWEAASIHQCGWKGGAKAPAYKERISKWGQLKMTPTEVDDPPFLIHFKDRSWEEWVEKWDAGRVSGKQVADEKAGRYSLENPSEEFLKTRPELEYTHFRDNVYKRVMEEGRIDEQVVVQNKKGKRCEMLYKIVGKMVTGPVRERCE